MKRTGMQPKRPPRRVRDPLEFATYAPRRHAPRAVMVTNLDARMSVPIPKAAYVRDERLRDMCRAMACQHCNRSGPDAGVTWAHSNQGAHGKGKGVKASDIYVAALCTDCHRECDQGTLWSGPLKLAYWTRAHRRTVQLGIRLGLWPRDIPPPEFDFKEALTMNTMYGDGSEHAACDKCGMCADCGDCECSPETA